MRSIFCAVLLWMGFSCSLVVAQNSGKFTTEQYIAKYKDIAILQMIQYGIPASITLAQGILESGNGNSELAKKANNHFGIKCKPEWTSEKYYYDDDEAQECFRKYPSDTASYIDHSEFLKSRERYASLFDLDPTDYKAWAKGLKAAGYATNPAYAESLIALIERFRLYDFDSPPLVSDSDSLPSDNYIVDAQLTIIENIEVKPIITTDTIEFGDVALSEGNRTIIVINGLRCTHAMKGDYLSTIGNDVGLSIAELADFNDMRQDDIIRDGSIVFLERKKKHASVEFYTVKEGDTWHSISQQHGIRLKSILKLNGNAEVQPVPGQKVTLK